MEPNAAAETAVTMISAHVAAVADCARNGRVNSCVAPMAISPCSRPPAAGRSAGAPNNRLALVPGRRREPELPGRQLVRPHDELIPILPLGRDHLVGGLEAVLVDLEVA